MFTFERLGCASVQRAVSGQEHETRSLAATNWRLARGVLSTPGGMHAHLPKPPRVIDYLNVSVHSVDAETPLVELESLFELHDCSTFVVEQDGARAGVVSRTDLFRAGRPKRSRTLVVPERCVGEIMSRELVALSAYAPLSQAARLMADNAVHQVFAIDDDKIGGLLTVRDVMRALVDVHLDTPIGELMTTKIISAQAHETMSVAVARLNEANKHALVVLEGEWPVGVLSFDEALVAREWPGDTPIKEWMSLRLLCLPVGMPAFRAAAHALAMRVNNVVAMDDHGMRGIVTGVDFAAAMG